MACPRRAQPPGRARQSDATRARAHRAPRQRRPEAPRIQIDEINHGQVEERHGSSAADLIAEIKAGHASAIEGLPGIDDGTLARELPLGFRPGTSTVGDMLRMAGAGHESSHLDAIEAALAGTPEGTATAP